MLLKALSEAVGVSGKEDAVRKLVLDALEGHVEDIRLDPLGGISALKRGSEPGRARVMVAAHMDEVGFMVTGMDGDGLLRFAAVGAVDDRILPGLRVSVGDQGLPGCIVWVPTHQNREQNVVKIKNLRIDIGATSKDNASSQVRPGDRIAFDGPFVELGGRVVRGKSFDDRAGCSLLIDLLQSGPYPVDVLAAFTVQEEIGVRGARVAAQRLNPDVAFVLEGTTANDIPNPRAEPDEDIDINPTARMGAGPVLTVMDRSTIVPPRMVQFLRETAESSGIPYQIKTMASGGTDAGAIHMAGAGRPTGIIAMPCRYIHSPTALLNLDDYENTLRLIQAVLNRITLDIFRA